MKLSKWQISRIIGRLLHPGGRGTHKKLGQTLLSEFGPFADVIYRGENRLTAHMVIKMMSDTVEVRDVLSRVESALAAGDAEFWLRKLFENLDWRTQLTGAVAVLLMDDGSPYAEMLWAAVIRGSWITPQLLVVLSIVDLNFVENCRDRIACNCNVITPKGNSDRERHRAMGPAHDEARAGKEAAAILELCQHLEPTSDWLQKANTDTVLRKIIASDWDGGGYIASRWRTALYEQCGACGVELRRGLA